MGYHYSSEFQWVGSSTCTSSWSSPAWPPWPLPSLKPIPTTATTATAFLPMTTPSSVPEDFHLHGPPQLVWASRAPSMEHVARGALMLMLMLMPTTATAWPTMEATPLPTLTGLHKVSASATGSTTARGNTRISTLKKIYRILTLILTVQHFS